ncbi:glycosyltransferase [Limosilactobacillus reuteri]|uniref:glycosyltransferase family 2 protein n=1 Tax=Limosilactobacillus reuteri TaxID=1598 RepID=UPI001E53B9A7|nr:glycosyltransferase family 2 protein [Limosilactobacillus reuteri]MCC4414511.1 glycosyltransferase [Limosilactobacillus reuteri]
MVQQLVSIIVPIYNAEKYFNRCLDSLVSQTYKKIEIILIDDGSLDKSSELCDAWAKRDHRIKVIHKANRGLSDARNVGIEEAKGMYLCFVDSDDFIEKTLIEETYSIAKKAEADIVIYSNYDVDWNGKRKRHDLVSSKEFYQNDEIMNLLFKESIGAMPKNESDGEVGLAPWGKLYKRSLIEKNSIFFKDEHKLMYEDLMFLLDLMPHVKRAVILNKPLYNYYQNKSSLTHTVTLDKFDRLKQQFYYLRENEPYRSEIFNDYETELRFKRTIMSYIRVFVIQCILNNVSYKNIKKICNDKLSKEIMAQYPIEKLPYSKAVFAYCIKYKLVFLLVFVVNLKEKLKSRK